MNQYLKDIVYGKGTQRQIDFLAHLGGMTDEEYKVFNLIHQQATDLDIQLEMALDKKTYARVEESVRAKLLLAVFECINCHLEHKE